MFLTNAINNIRTYASELFSPFVLAVRSIQFIFNPYKIRGKLGRINLMAPIKKKLPMRVDTFL